MIPKFQIVGNIQYKMMRLTEEAESLTGSISFSSEQIIFQL